MAQPDTCTICGAPVKSVPGAGLIHDGTLAEYRISVHERDLIMADAIHYGRDVEQRRPYNQLHKPISSRPKPVAVAGRRARAEVATRFLLAES